MVEALRAGITTLAATETSAAAAAALDEAGMRGIVYREVFGPDPAQCAQEMDGLRRPSTGCAAITRTIECGSASRRTRRTPSPTRSSPPRPSTRAEGLPMAVHAAESQVEEALVRAGAGDFAAGLRARGIDTPVRGRSTVEMLDRLGVLRARPLLIHCVRVDADDVRRMADAGCAVAHCPVANARLGHGTAPLRQMVEAGIRVGLGTDSVGSNNRLDLLEEARAASLLHRAGQRAHDYLSPAELLRLATVDGARALGMDDRVGTLEPGKDADLCAVSFAGAHVRPVHDPLAALFHAARGSDVVLTAVQGRVLYRDGRVLPLDEAALGAEVDAAAERLAAALG
jgi:aminodeoxyfutalosine deaminase